MTATAAAMLVDTLRAAGVEHVFANLGSDHPALIEALAADRARGERVPRVIVCPHEYTALSAAHGYALATGRPQAVFVHTDVGTANLGGAVHNAARARVPVLIFAGLTPYTLEGEEQGGRDTHVTFLQDVPDQHALVRPYAKWSYDLRTAANVPQVVLRALQLTRSSPAGPVYLTAAREVLAQSAPAPAIAVERWPRIAPAAAGADAVRSVVDALAGASRATIVTTSLGRDRDAVARLVALAERWGIGVVEYNAEVLSFPHDHPLHLGDTPDAAVEASDVLIVLDADVPWIPATVHPDPDARIFVVGDDPLQERIPLWYLPAEALIRADAVTFLDQLLEHTPDATQAHAARTRRESVAAEARRARDERDERIAADVAERRLSAGSVGATLARLIDAETVVVNEAITAAPDIWRSLPRTLPGTVFGNRGTSLGWSGGGALGIKLAEPDRRVVSIVGDGTFYFSAPSSAASVAARYGLATLTVILDNGGWNATRRNAVRQYPDGVAQRDERFWVGLGRAANLPGVARAAGGGWAATVTDSDDLEDTLRTALDHVDGGMAATVAVRLPDISTHDIDEPAAAAERISLP